MKKFLSCFLAVILAFSCLGIIVYAGNDGANSNDQYTKSYFVDVAPNFKSAIRIKSTTGTNYVKAGESFSFTIEVSGRYRFDQTTVVKYANTHKQPDMVKDMDDDAGNYDNGTIIYPDSNGVYTIPEVNEDLYNYTGLLNKKNISDVKDFLINLFAFFRDLMMWFFGLR